MTRCRRRSWGEGCVQCGGSGYHGRLGLYEILLSDEKMRDLITRSASIREITAHERATGHESLWDDARKKVALGESSLEKALRVLGPEPE